MTGMSGFTNIPVRLGDFSVIDDEFSSIRTKFDAEMRKMEEEMSKFRTELMNRESKFFGQSMVTSSSSRSKVVKEGGEELSRQFESSTNTQRETNERSSTGGTKEDSSSGGAKGKAGARGGEPGASTNSRDERETQNDGDKKKE